MANFNFTTKSEYALNTSLIEEMINLYGIEVKYVFSTKVNHDSTVFGDWSHLRTDSEEIWDVMMLPENTEDWDNAGEAFSQFGLVNFDNISLFISTRSLTFFADTQRKMIGDLIVLPNNKVMEITNADFTVPGINNLYTQTDVKSVIKISCKPYEFKLVNEMKKEDFSVAKDPETGEVGEFTALEDYFKEMVNVENKQDHEAEIRPSVLTTNPEERTKKEKPIIDTTESSPFGDFD